MYFWMHLVVCQVLCDKVVDATSNEDFLIYLDYFVQHLTTDILETFPLDVAYIPNRKGAVAISFKWPEIELDGCIVWVAR